jgi:hypothetical protein
VEKLSYFAFGCGERFSPKRRGPVNSPERFAIPLLCGFQVSLPLEALQQWVQTARADFVTVARKLLDHAQPEDWLLHSVMKHVQTNETRVQITVRRNVIDISFRFRHSITNGVSMWQA